MEMLKEYADRIFGTSMPTSMSKTQPKKKKASRE